MRPYDTMMDELVKLCAMKFTTEGGVVKLAQVTTQEAAGALKRLRELERKKPTPEQLTRGALAGSIVGPAGLMASKLVGGGVGKGLAEALRAKGAGGKAKGLAKALWGGTRQLGGAAASGAVFGAGLPTARSVLDREAEKEKLRQYLGTSKRGKLRRKASKYLGV
jgi:hypothetical protein